MKKKIAYIVHSLNLGGTERLAADMSIAFKEHYEIMVICLDEPGIWADQVRQEGVPVISFYRQPGLDMVIPYKLSRVAKRERIDIFHAHQTTPWFYTGLSRILYPKPKLLFEEHGRFYPEVLNNKKRVFNRFILQHLTHKVVAVSQDVRQRLFDFEGIDLEKIEVIYNGTTLLKKLSGREKKSLREKFGFKETDIVVGCIGRLDAIKNLPLFVKGFKKASESFESLKGILIGDGPLFNDTKALIARQHLEKDILMTGYQKNASHLVGILDVFCLVSFSEGTSMALIESMAQGVPSIVTNVGGNPEIVKDSMSGAIIPSDDIDAFSKTLIKLCKDKTLLVKMGTEAQKRFQDKFSFEHMVKNYNDLYRNMLS